MYNFILNDINLIKQITNNKDIKCIIFKINEATKRASFKDNTTDFKKSIRCSYDFANEIYKQIKYI